MNPKASSALCLPTRGLPTYVAICSGVACPTLTLAFSFRHDPWAAITQWPAWSWAALGLISILPFFRWLPRRQRAVLLASWSLFGLIFSEEPHSLVRTMLPEVPVSSSHLRVISLNCGGGSPEAAAEVAAYQPDIVLLQESPTEADVIELTRRLYGSAGRSVTGYDTAILARGELLASRPAKRAPFCVAASLSLPDGQTIEIVSLRLTPPTVRMDLWSPKAWQEHTDLRRSRREEMAEVLAHLATIPVETRVLVGGDFNTPAGDAVPRLLKPRLFDTFAASGRGWGNTAINDLPLSRIDQIWASRHFRSRKVAARKTQHSDHRMVICDLQPQP